MIEYLDVVDENDHIIGKNTRDNIHKFRKIHRGVHVLVINSEGEILVQKRSNSRRFYPGYLDTSVGGHPLSKESYEAAAVRETKQELGEDPGILIKICKYKSFSSEHREIRMLFKFESNGPFKIDKKEIEWVKFFPVKKILEMISRGEKFTEGFKSSFKHYLNSLKK
jgi:isopentenyldiphosphate isomerase